MDRLGREEWVEIQDRVMTLYGRGKLREALAIADRAAQSFPKRFTTTSYWRACLHSRLGEAEEALGVLREAVSRRAWWSEATLMSEEDFIPIRDLPEFHNIVRVCRGLAAEAASISEPQLVLLRPEGAGARAPVPLLLALHSRGGNARDFAHRWGSAVDYGVAVAVAQSSQPCATGQYCWDDEARAASDVAWVYERAAAQYGFDRDRVVLGGASQGARIGIQMALAGDTVPGRGFIAVVPALRDISALEAQMKGASSRGVRGYIIAGDQDRFYDGACRLHEAMKSCGLQSVLDVRQGMGHRFPPDFDSTLPRVLDFVLSQG